MSALPAFVEVPSRRLTVTVFRDLGASQREEYAWTFDELEDKLKSVKTYPTKAACPLIKLAKFGDHSTEKGSLRHDANILAVDGIEADYDGEKVSPADAQILLCESNISAIVYTSPSHTVEKPRWRVLCPLSRPYDPSERTRFVARLNGALGGILAPESFVLSQSYYAGRVEGAPYEVARVRGARIDELSNLDVSAIAPQKNGDSKAERLAKLTSSDPVIARLSERKLLLQVRPNGAADIVCPFEGEHTSPRAPADCTYFPPNTGGFARGHFKCLHSHCSGRSDTRFLEAIGLEAGESDGWQEPQPLVAAIAPEPYPLDALPEKIRAAVAEVQGFTKAPIPLVASSALAAISVVIQAHADVKRAEQLNGPVSLFLLTIADSGERKSTCDRFFTTAIKDYELQQAEAAKPDIARYSANLQTWEAKREGIKAKIRDQAKRGKATSEYEETLNDLESHKPQSPRVPKLLRGDDTPENLAWVLSREWPSSGVLSSEAGIVLGAHGMGKDSIMRNLGLLNILWDGGTLSIGRRTSESFTVRGARLTVALQVQEATLRSFFDRSGGLARGTGFLARFLVAWPESTQGFRAFTDPPASWPALATFNRRIAAILDQPAPIDGYGALTPPMLTLTTEAKTAWVEHHDEIERELASGGELYDVRDVASKTADNAARLAALFHTFEDEDGGVIGPECFEGAARIAAWHLGESRRFFGELALPPELANAARLDSWLIDYCRRGRTHIVPRREVQRCGPNGVRNKGALADALRELVEAGRVREVHEARRRDILVNPALLPET